MQFNWAYNNWTMSGVEVWIWLSCVTLSYDELFLGNERRPLPSAVAAAAVCQPMMSRAPTAGTSADRWPPQRRWIIHGGGGEMMRWTTWTGASRFAELPLPPPRTHWSATDRKRSNAPVVDSALAAGRRVIDSLLRLSVRVADRVVSL